MRTRSSTRWLSIFLLATLAGTGCGRPTNSGGSQVLTAARASAIDTAVRALMSSVARDVTQEGPLAWLKYFETAPSFFMAVNGQMAFPNRAAADEGTQSFARTISHIELEWSDVRVDPLTPEFALVASPWHERQVDVAGRRVEEGGFFTGVAEYRDGQWQFRDAHWSSPVSPPH